ncbi:hypothetical protein [Paenibacillus sp. 1781tsa1]|uniref:hypothetical protein n=1 Tax=Paenibacillus sp. 1781tsa1 TaxID=2953810 RepID=UPI00209DA694|nr:hypothetical protein [Paenibacillus sp. 1781tsa1]MCP1182622.1 hypothetical protein [Paenibacillus sp. 1781tsa1]
MADIAKRLSKGALITTVEPLYTVPSGKRVFVKALSLCNTSTSETTVTLFLAGTLFMYQHAIKGRDTLTIPFIDHIIEPGETISAFSSAQNITYYISGREVDI